MGQGHSSYSTVSEIIKKSEFGNTQDKLADYGCSGLEPG